MSKPKHVSRQIDNSLTDLVSMLGVAQATGGSQLSGYGSIGYADNYNLITRNWIMLTYLFSGNGLFQTAVQLPVQDALAKRIKLELPAGSPEDVDAVLDWFEEHGVWQHLENFWSWVRVYGGGALVVNTDQDPEQPLNYRRLKGAPIEFYDMDRWQISARNFDAMDPLLCYDISNADQLYVNGVKMHASRAILGKGKQAPVYIRRQLFGWGMSEAERMLRDLNNYIKTQDVLYEILDESKIDVYHIQGLANKLATVGGSAIIRNRIQAANEIKNYVNALVLDKEEDFEQKTLTFSGLSEVMAENRIGIASALRMPMTKLFGLSASGFSTGESDTDNYNQMVESEIQAKMRPAIRECIKIACANIWGNVPEFRFTFPPLKVLPEIDAQTIRESKINSLCALHDRGLIASGKAIGVELAKDEVISSELAAAFVDAPIPPAGDAMPVQNDKVSIFRAAKQNAAAMVLRITGRAPK